jgi:PAS domain S-box-containing protein
VFDFGGVYRLEHRKAAVETKMSKNGGRLDHEQGVMIRAHAIWEREGCPEGGHLEHWRQAEQEMAAERRLRMVVEAAPNAMVMVDGAGAIVMVNAQTEQLFGYRQAELLGQSIEVLVPERYRASHPGLCAAFFADPRPRPMGSGRDLFAVKKDGREFPVEIGLNPIDTDEGPMVLAAVVDISQRKAAELALHEGERRYRSLAAIVESSEDAIVSTDLVAVMDTRDLEASLKKSQSLERERGRGGRRTRAWHDGPSAGDTGDPVRDRDVQDTANGFVIIVAVGLSLYVAGPSTTILVLALAHDRRREAKHRRCQRSRDSTIPRRKSRR